MPGVSTWPKASARAGPLYWRDGDTEVQAEPEALGDVVLARKDAPVSYHLAVTVDDSAQGVTDVVRGRDLYAATDVHRLLQALLGLPTPLYHHHPLLLDARGPPPRQAPRRTDPARPARGGRRPAGAGRGAAAPGRLPSGYSAGGSLDRRDEHFPPHPDRPRRRSDALRPRQGVIGMASGKDITGQRSQDLMRKRVMFQAIAIVLVILFLLVASGKS